MDYILEVNHLTKKYKDFELKDISFKLELGYIMGLIGPNGAGKTTLIKALLGLYKQNAGEIKIGGYRLNEDVKKVKDMVGFVLDDSPFIKEATAIENGNLFGVYYSFWDKSKFISYLNEFGVPLKTKISKLSKGTEIKFQLAFALSHNAKLIIMDEPSSGLDPVFRRELLELMYDIIIDGERSILISTHLTKELDKVADYITFINQGEQILSASKEEYLDNYKLIKCHSNQLKQIDSKYIIGSKMQGDTVDALVLSQGITIKDNVVISQPNIEDIMYYYVRGENKA